MGYFAELGNALLGRRGAAGIETAEADLGVVEERATLADPDPALIRLFGGAETASGVRVDEVSSLNYPPVFACIRALAESVASLPLILYERIDDESRRRAIDHHLYHLLHDEPNPQMTAITFIEAITAHAVSWGGGFAEIERDNAGRPIALWPLLPDRTWAERKGGQLRYKTIVSSKAFVLPPSKVLHVPGFGFDGVNGYSPLYMFRQTTGLGLAAEEFGARFFGSGMHTSGLVEMPGRFRTRQERQRFRENLQEVHGGLSQAHRIAVLENGAKWVSTSIPPDDAQFLQTRSFQAKEFPMIYRIPPHVVGILDNATFSNIEHQGLEFVTYSLRPWLKRWEQAILRRLINAQDRSKYYAEFLIDDLLRGDQPTRFAAYATGLQNGIFSINNVLAKENMNGIGPAGDVRRVQLNLAPINGEEEADEEEDIDLMSFEEEEESEAQEAGADDRDHQSEVEIRSATSRRRHQRRHRGLIRDAARLGVRRETSALKKALHQSFQRGGVEGFRQWMVDFYPGHADWLARKFRPGMISLAAAVFGEAAREVDGDEEMSAEMEAFVVRYSESLGSRMVSSSEGQLRKIIAESDPEEIEGALAQRANEWEEKRADKVADREIVQLGNAVTKAAYVANGISKLVWRASGNNCPLCDEMDGKIVEITRSFVESGDSVDPKDGKTSPLSVTRSFGHPPLHEGCDCTIGPA